MNTEQLTNHLIYASYARQRSEGLTHEALVNAGLGDEDMRRRYEQGDYKPDPLIADIP